jgi:isopentenyldiphosphate isomerase
MTERLTVVDENDQPIGVASREEAWAKGLILRHAYCVIRDEDGNFLMQQRSFSLKSRPAMWNWAATGHVDEGESYEVAAAREMLEEVGIATELTFIGKLRSTQQDERGIVDCFIGVFTGTISRDTKITVDPIEVATTRWLTPTELRELMSDPSKVTHNSRLTYQEFFAQQNNLWNTASLKL